MTARFRYYTATTLDGFLADDRDDLGWLLRQPIDENGPMNYTDFIGDIGVVVMGATTYRWVVDHEVGDGKPWPYTTPTFVFTHRDLDAVAPSIRFVSGAPADLRETLLDAAGGKDIWVVGGGDLAAQFAEAAMLDEVIVNIAPVMLGSGRPLFTRPADLRLIEHGRNEAFVCARYEVVGPAVADGVGAAT